MYKFNFFCIIFLLIGLFGLALNARSEQIPVTYIGAQEVLSERAVAEFPVASKQFYNIELQVETPAPAYKLLVDFYDEAGENISKRETELGFSLSRLSALVPENSVSYEVSGIAGRHSFCKPVKAEIRISPEAALKLRAIKVTQGESSKAWTSASRGELLEQELNEKCAVNLVVNASFEEMNGKIPVGWHYEGPGSPDVSDQAYAGKRALSLTKENDNGQWISQMFTLQKDVPVHVLYWVKFSQHATISGHAPVVEVKFFRKDGEKYYPVNYPHRRWFSGVVEHSNFFGQYFCVVEDPLIPPAEATHACAVMKYQDIIEEWNGPSRANWGELLVDNVAVWQAPKRMLPPSLSKSRYMMLLGENELLPPQLPVDSQRSNSGLLFPMLTRDANFFYESDKRPIVLQVVAGNLLSVSRKFSIKAQIRNSSGKEIKSFSQEAEFSPWGYKSVELKMPQLDKFGPYYVDVSMFDGRLKIAECTVRMGWLPYRNRVSDEERLSDDYPFDFHPTQISMERGSYDLTAVEHQLYILRQMGVRGIRLQSRFFNLTLDDAQQAAAGAERKVQYWRENILPLMQKHKISGWVSLMEQGNNNLPRVPQTPDEFKAWNAYIYAQTQAMGNDIDLVIFGNEGLGGYTASAEDDACLAQRSAFAGTTRDWFRLYHEARKSSKAANPSLPFGPGHASDFQGVIAKRFINSKESGNELDVFAVNAYGESGEMVEKIGKILDRPNLFGVIPEVGVALPYKNSISFEHENYRAAKLVLTYISILQRAPWIKRIAWFCFMCAGTEGHGVFDKYWCPRPAALAYTVMTDTLGAGRVVFFEKVAGNGRFYLWKRNNGTWVGICWNANKQTLSFKGKSPVEVSDVFGNRTTITPERGVLNIPIPENLCYIISSEPLSLSKNLEFRAFNASQTSAPRLDLEIKNNSETAETLNIEVLSHPLVRISPRKTTLKIAPISRETISFNVKLVRSNNRVRTPVEFKITTDSGVTFQTSWEDTFTMCVRAPGGFQLDGTWKNWKRAQALHADQKNQVVCIMPSASWKEQSDLSAEILTMWDEKYFYLGCKVTDDVYFASQPIERAFLADSLEIGFANTTSGGIIQFGAALHPQEGAQVYRHMPAPCELVRDAKIFVKPTGEAGNAEYQIAIPWSQINNVVPKAGQSLSFGIIVDDSDGKLNDRKFISWFGHGIHLRQMELLGKLNLVE